MLQQGVLKPRSTEAALIGALVVQIEIGDYKEYFNEFEQSSDYLHQIIIYPDHERKPDLLNRIAQEHKKLRGIDPQVGAYAQFTENDPKFRLRIKSKRLMYKYRRQCT